MQLVASAKEPIVIGLAGAIGSGKSTVASMLAGKNLLHIDFDKEVSKAFTLPEVAQQIQSRWGDHVFNAHGSIDKKALADIVFADESERLALEAIIHPVVWRTNAQAVSEARIAGCSGALIDAPLLFEVGLHAECDLVIFVDAEYEIRLNRVVENRGWDAEELIRREQMQWEPCKKRRLADVLIENNGSLTDLTRSVNMVYSQYVEGR